MDGADQLRTDGFLLDDQHVAVEQGLIAEGKEVKKTGFDIVIVLMNVADHFIIHGDQHALFLHLTAPDHPDYVIRHLFVGGTSLQFNIKSLPVFRCVKNFGECRDLPLPSRGVPDAELPDLVQRQVTGSCVDAAHAAQARIVKDDILAVFRALYVRFRGEGSFSEQELLAFQGVFDIVVAPEPVHNNGDVFHRRKKSVKTRDGENNRKEKENKRKTRDPSRF